MDATAASQQRSLQRSNSFASSGARAEAASATPRREPLTEYAAAAAAATMVDAPDALRAAAGSADDRRRRMYDLDANRRVKRSMSLPRRRAPGASAIAHPEDQDKYVRGKGSGFGGVAASPPGAPAEARPASAALAAVHNIPLNPAAAPLPMASHDKSIKNTPRSRRAAGSARKPAPLVASALPDGGFDAAPISALYGATAPRKARGLASPYRERPNPIAPTADAGEVQGITILSATGSGFLSGRGRGFCSPSRERRPAPFEWN